MRISTIFSLAAAVAMLTTGEALASETVDWDFTGNSKASSSSQDVTGSTWGFEGDASVGHYDVDPSETDSCRSQCANESFCMCTPNDNSDPQPDLDSWGEISVACRGGEILTPESVSYDVKRGAGGRDPNVHLFVNNDGFVGYEEVSDSPKMGSGSNFVARTHDVSDLDPRPYFSFRFHASDAAPASGLEIAALLDNVTFEGSCAEDGGDATDGILKTATVRTGLHTRRAECNVTNVSNASITVDVTLIDEDNMAVAGTPTMLMIPAGETQSIGITDLSQTDYRCEVDPMAASANDIRARIKGIQAQGGSVDGSEAR